LLVLFHRHRCYSHSRSLCFSRAHSVFVYWNGFVEGRKKKFNEWIFMLSVNGIRAAADIHILRIFSYIYVGGRQRSTLNFIQFFSIYLFLIRLDMTHFRTEKCRWLNDSIELIAEMYFFIGTDIDLASFRFVVHKKK
jgi:hypothetical protein